MPPRPTRRSEATPSAGLAVMPEKPSEPPHSSATLSSEAGIGSREMALTSGRSAWICSTIVAMVLVVPPVSWMVRPWKRSAPDEPKCRLHPRDLHHLAAEADEDRGADVRVRGVAPEHALQVVEAGAVGGHAAAGAVGEGDDAVDVGVVGEDAGGHHLLGGAADHRGRAVHRGADRDVVAGADLAVGAAVAHEGARRRPPGSRPGRPRGRRRSGSPGRGRRTRSSGCGRARRRRSAWWRSR